jgi:hypothetical protein
MGSTVSWTKLDVLLFQKSLLKFPMIPKFLNRHGSGDCSEKRLILLFLCSLKALLIQGSNANVCLNPTAD